MTELPIRRRPCLPGSTPGVPHHLPVGKVVPIPLPPLQSPPPVPLGAPCICPPSSVPVGRPASDIGLTSKRVIELPEADQVTPEDRILVDSPGLGTRQATVEDLGHALGSTKVVRVILTRGPFDDWATLPVGPAVQATVWSPAYPSGQPLACGMEIIFAPDRLLRISITKDLVGGGAVDVVLTGT